MSEVGRTEPGRGATAKFHIHTGAVPLRDYHDRIGGFLAGPDVPIYLDTSALTWMIRVGSGAREELLRWFERDGVADRIFVPIWAAHELHGVLRNKGPLNDANTELGRHRKALQGMLTDLAFQAGADRCGGEDVTGFIEQVLVDLRDLGAKLGQMTKGDDWYRSAERRVVEFVNGRVLDGDILSLVDEVLPAAERRHSVRLPPGYLDADKRDNRAGDVVFWKEILRHAKENAATRLVVLTNDNKDDWSYTPGRVMDYLGNEQGDDPSKGLQARLPHPMLVHEARSFALDDVLMLNPTLLAVALDRLDQASVKALVAATHPPRLVPAAAAGVDWDKIDPPVSNRRQRREAAAGAVPPPPSELPVDLAATLTSAVRERGAPGIPATDLVAKLDGDAHERLEAFEALTGRELLDSLALAGVAAVGRALYRAAGDDDRVAGLIRQAVGGLGESSPPLANALLAGMWAEVYFDDELRPRRTLRHGPHETLFSLTSDPAFAPALQSISDLLAEPSMRLLVRPDGSPTTLAVHFSTKRAFDGVKKLLEQVRLDDIELLCEVEPGSPDALNTLLGGSEGSVEQLLDAIARRFTVPKARLSPDIDIATPLRWLPDLGLRILEPSGDGVVDPSGSDGN